MTVVAGLKRVRAHGSIVVAAVALVFGWPIASVAAGGDLDSGYRYALTAWATGRLGSRPVVFTYGPLGFLNAPQAWYRGPYVLELLFTLTVLFALAWLIARRVERAAGLIVALFVAWLAVVTSFLGGTIEPAVLVALLLVAEVWDGELPSRTVAWVLGVAAPFLILVKVTSSGVIVIGLLALLLTSAEPIRRRLQSAAAALLSVLLATVLLWVLLGHPFGQLGDYERGVFAYTFGYDVESLELPGRTWEYVVAALAAAGVLGLAAQRRGQVRIAALVVWALALYVDFKHGFTRHDAHSIAYFSAALGGAVAAAPMPRRESRRAAWRVLAPAGVVVGLLAGTLLHLTADVVPAVKKPWSAPRLLAHAVGVAVDNRRWNIETATSRAAIRATLVVPPAMIARIGPSPVDLLPFQDGVIWAYRLHYAPLPVLQPYTAFTTWLDKVDQREIRGGAAAEYILSTSRQAGLDSRYPPANSGGFQLELQCRYHPVMSGGIWTLYQRNPSRCGAPSRVSRVVVRPGQTVAVPQDAGGLVFARITTHPGLGFALRKTLFKTTPVPRLIVNGRAYRLMWTAPGQPTPLSVLRATSSGTTSIVTATQLAVDRLPGTVEIEFYAVPYQGD